MEEVFISNVYDCKSCICSNQSYSIFILLNTNILVELDIFKTDMTSPTTLNAFIFKNKAEGKVKILKYEYNIKTNNSHYDITSSNSIWTYSVLISLEDNKILRAIWKFSQGESIITMKFRPKCSKKDEIPQTNENLYENHSIFSVSFHGGRLKVFHYESCALRHCFKTIYGNILALNYSQDGKMLGLGTENDNAYIIDGEANELLFCLEGHRNYVTNVIFDEQISQEDEPGTTTNLHARYESNSSLQIGSSLNLGYASLRQGTSGQFVNKEISLDELSTLLSDSEGQVDIRLLRKNRSSLVPTHTGLSFKDNVNNIIRSSTTYDVYTGAMDGYFAVWRIEHFYEEGYVNPANYSNVIFTKDVVQTMKPEKLDEILLNPTESMTICCTDMAKIGNGPICLLEMADNMIVAFTKINIAGSWLYLNFFHGVLQVEDLEVCEEHDNKKESDLTTKYEKLKQSGINIKSSDENSNYFNSLSPCMKDALNAKLPKIGAIK